MIIKFTRDLTGCISRIFKRKKQPEAIPELPESRSSESGSPAPGLSASGFHEPDPERAEPEKAAKPDDALCILIVEDEFINRLFIENIIEDEGHTALCAENGQEALEILKKEPVDLVLMDVQMPVMNGVEAVRRIRSSSIENVSPAIPVVALTAMTRKEDREQLKQAGMDDFIPKPVDSDHLIHVISRIMQSRKPVSKNRKNPSAHTGYAHLQPGTLLDALNGNKDIFYEILETYINTAPEIIQRVAAAMNTLNDMDDNARHLHTILKDIHLLTGMLGTMRVLDAHQRSFELETSAHAGELQKMKDQFDGFRETMDQLTQEVRQALDARTAEGPC